MVPGTATVGTGGSVVPSDGTTDPAYPASTDPCRADTMIGSGRTKTILCSSMGGFSQIVLFVFTIVALTDDSKKQRKL